MDAKGIRRGLNDALEAKEDLEREDRRAEMGNVYISVDGDLYEVAEVRHMTQRDETTVVCPIIVAGPKL